MYSTPEPEPNISVTKPTREYHTVLTYNIQIKKTSDLYLRDEVPRKSNLLLKIIYEESIFYCRKNGNHKSHHHHHHHHHEWRVKSSSNGKKFRYVRIAADFH
ncbi:hypothetical protein GQX74_002416 [Glossina fuscipes]|nr:hypothetical protein GQX74_002416 [Glossina fuscipes]